MLLVVGWDAASPEQIDRYRSAGLLPVIDGLLRRGRAFRVRSTVPAVTFPAWTSFLTGTTPDRHGITDFTMPRPGAYGVRFVNATQRQLPTFLARMAAAGLRAGMYGMPATYPPEGRAVFEICGFDTPLGAAGKERAVHPPGLGRELRARHGRLGIEGIRQTRIDEGWHERTRRQLLDDIALRTRISIELLREQELDVFVLHFMEPDTVSHHFWCFEDEGSPHRRARRLPGGAGAAIAEVYAALDRSLGELLAATGEDTELLLLSDHGSAGASDRVIFWNRWLADAGFLGFEPLRREAAALRLKRLALSAIPPEWQARAFAAAGGLAGRLESGARFAGIDWPATRVYSDELPYFPSLRLNLEGREPRGSVAPAARETLVAELEAALLAMRDPFDGGAVVERVHRREELFDGPFADRYPDLVLELRRPGGYAYAAGSSAGGREKEALRLLRDEELAGGKGSVTSGVHGDYGFALLAGPRAAAACAPDSADRGEAALPECRLEDLGVTAMELAGLEADAAMTGRSLLARRGDLREAPSLQIEARGEDYDEQEEREVAERLRALGYLP